MHDERISTFSEPLVPPDSAWDPAEELAFMLQESQEEYFRKVPPSRDEENVTEPAPGAHLRNLQDITEELPPLRVAPRGHRKVRKRRSLIRTASFLVAAVVALIASAVTFISGIAAYDPLRLVAVSDSHKSVASWWPLLVYGPWLAGSFSVLRAALHQRRAVHSWCVVLLFSAIAILLSVAQAPKTVIDASAAALPSLATLACFQQLVRQITMTRPPQRSVRPRHRLRPKPPGASSDEESPRQPGK